MILFADYETYYDSDYSLRKMTPAEYILDPRFRVHGMGAMLVKSTYHHGPKNELFPIPIPRPVSFLEPDRVVHLFSTLRLTNHPVTMVTYNALFDMCITAWRYNYVPDLMIDVLGMVRAMHGPALPNGKASLAAAAKYLDVPVQKRQMPPVIGLSLEEIKRRGLWDEYAEYGKDDVMAMHGIYMKLRKDFPRSEYDVMDLVLRTTVQPQFVYDKPLLVEHLKRIKEQKEWLLQDCGLSYDEFGRVPELLSAVKFQALLEAEGVIVQTKISPTGNEIPALAKTDQFMQELLEDENPKVAALAAARLGHKSTLEETRTVRYISIAGLPDAPGYKGGSAPIPLRYGAAHTHRLGGDWGLNKQNLPRQSPIRKGLKAPPGYTVITADEAQIEARLSAWLCGETTLLKEFADDLDPYAKLAEAVFKIPVNKKDNPVERFIGKTGILGLGYGAGADKFWTMVHTLAKAQLGRDIEFTHDQAQEAVNTYRSRYNHIPAAWKLLQKAALPVLLGSAPIFAFPPVVFEKGKIIYTINKQEMIYPDLTTDPVTGEVTYRNGNTTGRLFGPKILENVTQWLARVIVMDAAVRLHKSHGFLRMAMQAHDELVFVVPTPDVEWARCIIEYEMTMSPIWAPELPLKVEIGVGVSYGEAK